MSRSPRFNLNKPLSLSTSKVVLRAYASHGKTYARQPPVGTAITVLAVNAARETRWEAAVVTGDHSLACQALEGEAGRGWKYLGWVMADGSLPFGDLESIDPAICQFDNLGPCHTDPHLWHEGGHLGLAPR